LVVTNILGKWIHEQSCGSERSDIDLSTHPPGIYFLKIKTDKEEIVKKLIIQ
jgi:hypothetical protein